MFWALEITMTDELRFTLINVKMTIVDNIIDENLMMVSFSVLQGCHHILSIDAPDVEDTSEDPDD
jgi:hypothetical protein